MARGEARRTPRGSAGSARRVKALSKLSKHRTTPPHTAFEWGHAPTARDPGALRALFRSKIHGTHTLRGFRARRVRLEDARWGGVALSEAGLSFELCHFHFSFE